MFPDLGDATLIGYDGQAPGPTFRVAKGRETVVRFVNEYYRPSAIHLHGSYSRARKFSSANFQPSAITDMSLNSVRWLG